MFFSVSDSNQFGSFRPTLALVDYQLSEEAAEVVGSGAAIGDLNLSFERERRLLYEVVSYFHEMRHLYDCFGTLAGLSMISQSFQAMKSFALTSTHLRKSGKVWEIPLPSGVTAEQLDSRIRSTALGVRATYFGVGYFQASFDPFFIEGHLESPYIKVPAGRGGQEIDAFPLRVMGGVEGKPLVPQSRILPLGFEAFAEGTAHAISRTFAESYFSDEVARSLVPTVFKREIESNEKSNSWGEMDLPYNTTDLMISRYLRGRGIERFPRNLVLAATDIVLSRARLGIYEIELGKYAIEISSFGEILMEVLSGATDLELSSGVISDQKGGELYMKLLTELEKGEGWNAVSDYNDPFSSILIWESYVAQHVTIPLLRARMESNHKAFTTSDGFFSLSQKFVPPVAVKNGKLGFDDDVPMRVRQAWGHVVMVDDLMRQIGSLAPIIRCPRVHMRVPGADSIVWTRNSKQSCDWNFKRGCGAWAVNGFQMQPDCLFTSALHSLAIDRPQ